MLDFSKFPHRFPQRLSLHAGVFPNPKSKNYSRTSSSVIPLRMHEEKSLSFHFRCKGFGFGLNNSLCKTSQLHSFTLERVGDDVIKRLALDFLNTGLWQLPTDCRAPQWHTRKPALAPSHSKPCGEWELFWYAEVNKNICTSCFSINMLCVQFSFLGKCLLSPLPVECIPPWRRLTSQSYVAGNSFARCRFASMYGLL